MKKTEKKGTTSTPKPPTSSHKPPDKNEDDKVKTIDTRLSKLESMLTTFMEHQSSVISTPAPVSAPVHTASARCDDELVLDYHYDEYDYHQPGPSYSHSAHSGNDEAEIDYTDNSCHSEPGPEAGASTAQEKVVSALVAKFATQADVGPDLDEEIANSTLFLMNNKLEEKILDETSAKYLPPANCATLDAPKVNQTIGIISHPRLEAVISNFHEFRNCSPGASRPLRNLCSLQPFLTNNKMPWLFLQMPTLK